MIEKIFQDIDDLKAELDQIQFPNGGREAPARSCKDLYLAHPEFKDGMYPVDVWGGVGRGAGDKASICTCTQFVIHFIYWCPLAMMMHVIYYHTGIFYPNN